MSPMGDGIRVDYTERMSTFRIIRAAARSKGIAVFKARKAFQSITLSDVTLRRDLTQRG